jgi:hypothetical protein
VSYLTVRIFNQFIMRKISLLALLILFQWALQAETIEKTYHFLRPVITEINGYQQISFGNDLLTAPAGEPALPYSSVSLLLPPGHVATSIEFVGENEVMLEGSFSLWPYQPSRPLSETKKAIFVKNEKLYSADTVYPLQQNGRLTTQFLNGHGFALSTFTPVKYNPVNGTVSYYTKVTIRITTAPAHKAEVALKNLSNHNSVLSSIQKLAQNPDMVFAYPVKSLRSEDAYKLLIITPAQFESDFDELRDIYLSRGAASKVITKEYISASIDGQDLQEKIRNLIIQEYQESGIEYVLLGGDVELIPYRGFYCYVESGGGYTDLGIPADLYYSGLDGNWNDDGDNKWAEPDEDDLLPDIAVARFPFSNSDELSNLINKSISYQNSPVLGEFQKPLLAGEHLYNTPETWGMDYLELLIGEHDDNGYTTIGIPETYNIDKMYEHDAAWGGSDLMEKVNQGRQFVHHVGHASPAYVAHLYSSDITDANFYGANGIDHNFTIMQTHGCDCGSFDNDDCILERMVNIHNFAVAVIGNSRFGWFNEGQTEGPAAHLHREMVDAMFHEEIAQIGKAFVECKIQTAPWVEAPGQHEEGAMRWNFYDINILGDPAMSVWNDEPIDVDVTYPVEVMLGTTSIEVTVSSEGEAKEGFNCAILKEGELRSSGVTNENGVATMVFDPPVTEVGDGMLIVSGYNCLPDTNDILFIPAEGPYVVYAESIIDDAAGNGNGLIDFGEQIALDLSLRNVGNDDAIDVDAVMYQDNYEWFTITDGGEHYGFIASADTVMKEQAFSFEVANNIPDQTVLKLFIDAIDGGQTWTSGFQLIANAPQLDLYNMIIDDSQTGNNNGMLDPGETATILIPVVNKGHSDCEGAIAGLSSGNLYISFNSDSFNLGDMAVDDSIVALFEVVVDPLAPSGTPVEFQLETTTGAYAFSNTYHTTIGIIKEDFETGDFSAFEWANAGNMPWEVITENPFEGVYSAKSGAITHNQSSGLTISMETVGDGEISFHYKVSSEQNWDFLKFYLDGTVLGKWSGETDWEEVSFPVSQGAHVLLWAYEKDPVGTAGSDCAWLDNIVFPATTTLISTGEIVDNQQMFLYPNPTAGLVYISSEELISGSHLQIFDVRGNVVFEQTSFSNNGMIQVDLSHQGQGLYFIKISSEAGTVVKMVVVE